MFLSVCGVCVCGICLCISLCVWCMPLCECDLSLCCACLVCGWCISVCLCVWCMPMRVCLCMWYTSVCVYVYMVYSVHTDACAHESIQRSHKRKSSALFYYFWLYFLETPSPLMTKPGLAAIHATHSTGLQVHMWPCLGF